MEDMMLGEDIILMSGEELRRVGVIRRVLDRGMTQAKAAGILGLSERQVRRIVKRVGQEGDRGIIHKSRGRPSNRRLPGGLKERVLGFYRESRLLSGWPHLCHREACRGRWY